MGAGAGRIRDARPEEASDLTALALRSKAHWGYDPEFLDACRPVLTMDPTDIGRDDVGVLELEGRVVGFLRITGEPPSGELADLWVEPGYVGRGLGAQLVDDAVRRARKRGFRTLLVESDPNAEGFYARLGATKVGERESPVLAGRRLPLMRIEVED